MPQYASTHSALGEVEAVKHCWHFGKCHFLPIFATCAGGPSLTMAPKFPLNMAHWEVTPCFIKVPVKNPRRFNDCCAIDRKKSPLSTFFHVEPRMNQSFFHVPGKTHFFESRISRTNKNKDIERLFFSYNDALFLVALWLLSQLHEIM